MIIFSVIYFLRHLYTRCETSSVVKRIKTARLRAILHVVSYTLIFVLQSALKLTLINHGVSGVWSMDLLAKT